MASSVQTVRFGFFRSHWTGELICSLLLSEHWLSVGFCEVDNYSTPASEVPDPVSPPLTTDLPRSPVSLLDNAAFVAFVLIAIAFFIGCCPGSRSRGNDGGGYQGSPRRGQARWVKPRTVQKFHS